MHHRRCQCATYNECPVRAFISETARRMKPSAFTYQNDRGQTMQEIHIFSLGRNDGRGVRIKVPAAAHKAFMPITGQMLGTFDPGRDQNAVSPFVPKEKTDR